MSSPNKTRRNSVNRLSKRVVASAEFQARLDKLLQSLVNEVKRPGPIGMTHGELAANHVRFMRALRKTYGKPKGGAKRITRKRS